jgi:hypothetical protein
VAAVRQKMRALADRRQPEARDVFDLHVLAAFVDAQAPAGGLPAATIEEARARLYEIDYPDYRDKVVAFLAPDHQAAHDRPEVWDEIRLGVVELLDRWHGRTGGGGRA